MGVRADAEAGRPDPSSAPRPGPTGFSCDGMSTAGGAEGLPLPFRRRELRRRDHATAVEAGASPTVRRLPARLVTRSLSPGDGPKLALTSYLFRPGATDHRASGRLRQPLYNPAGWLRFRFPR